MDTPVIATVTRFAIVDLLKATSGYLDGLVVRLFQNDITLTPAAGWGDLVEATFSGYAASSAVVWGSSYVDALGRVHTTAASKQFTASGSTVANVCYGYAVTTSGGSPALKWAVKFPAPVAFAATGNAVIVQPDFAFPPQ